MVVVHVHIGGGARIGPKGPEEGFEATAPGPKRILELPGAPSPPYRRYLSPRWIKSLVENLREPQYKFEKILLGDFRNLRDMHLRLHAMLQMAV